MTTQLQRYTAFLLTIWIGAGLISLAWNLYDNRQERKELALLAARTFLTQIQNTRTWISLHQGVYVPVTEKQQPNPYLENEPARDFTTTTGIQLTKISPATMIRELSAIAGLKKGATFHISSLNPVNTNNYPLAWEKPWLQSFSSNARERSSIIKDNGKKIFRFMAPIIVKRECLNCHAERKYSIGDIRGGISIALPMEESGPKWPLLLSHFGPMAAGSLLILVFSARLNTGREELLRANQNLRKEIQQRKEAQHKLQDSQNQLEKRVTARTLELSEVNKQLNRKIHERAHIEEALTMIYDEFYQLFNTAPDSMLVIDKKFNIIRINRAFSELCRLPDHKIIGHKCFELFPGATCHTKHCPLCGIIKGSKRVETETNKSISDHSSIPCIITATPFLEPDGTLIGAIMVITDISKQKATELALEHSTDRLKESNRALEDFAHIISHDLQEPLMLIQAFSKRLRNKMSKELNVQCNRYLEQINTAANRMHELIQGLLLYSRLNNTTQKPVPVDLSIVLEQVLEDLALRLERSHSTISSDRLPIVPGNPLQLRQVLQNIIGNSIKYRRNNLAHTIDIRYAGVVKDQNGNRFAKISIEDNGTGFTPEDGQNIFTIFTRLPQEKGVEGTGIGLAICKRIIERHGGKIEASGRSNQGATFTLFLPVEETT